MARSSQRKIYDHHLWSSLSSTSSNAAVVANGQLLVTVDHNQIRRMASETVDPIDRPLPSTIYRAGIEPATFGIPDNRLHIRALDVLVAFSWVSSLNCVQGLNSCSLNGCSLHGAHNTGAYSTGVHNRCSLHGLVLIERVLITRVLNIE